MKDIPMFTTEYGVASLILKEIPYRGEAYVRVQDVQSDGLAKLLVECGSFCRMAGADHVYATYGAGMEPYPLHTTVLRLRHYVDFDAEHLACLFPVTESTVGQWRQIYNQRMHSVDNAATLDTRDQRRILEKPGAYFVHHSGELLGIGWLEEETLLAVAAVKPGAGEQVMRTLMSLLKGRTMTLDVASTNTRALRLYEKMGFLTVGEVSRWYEI